MGMGKAVPGASLALFLLAGVAGVALIFLGDLHRQGEVAGEVGSIG
jgi:hypothetical protein